MNITQPAVSQHIRYLETYYGHRLFQSKGKKIYLTAAGEALFHATSTMAQDEIHLRRKLDAAAQEEKRLVLGVTMTIGEYVLAPHLANYIQTHPSTSIHVIVANTQELLKKLANHEIDFAIVEGYFSKKDYDYRKYAEVPFIGVCSKNHRNSDVEITLEDLFCERLIVRESGSGTREIFEKALEERNYSVSDFANIIEINSMNSIKTLVEENCGIAFLYRAAVEKELKSGELREMQVKDFKQTHDFTFIWSKGSIFADEYHELYEALR